MNTPKKLLLFDLDGTLLNSHKKISKANLEAINKCKEAGYLIGIATARGEKTSLFFLGELNPDITITSDGALVKKDREYIPSWYFLKKKQMK